VIYPSEPPWIGAEDLNKFLLWAFHERASDVLLESGATAWIRIDGCWSSVTSRTLGQTDLEGLLNGPLTRQANATSRLNSGMDMNFAYEVREDRLTVRRFRVNASSCARGGLAIVFRTMPSAPPALVDLNLESAILPYLTPANGLVIITGVMGSGKSTLLASIIRHIRETQARKIRTYESPIEFDLTNVPGSKGPIVQMDIPLNLSSWEEAPRNASRSASDVILVGEANDRQTMRGMLHLTQMGVAAYSTAHTQSVADTPSRIIEVFSGSSDQGDERLTVKGILISSLRLVVYQRLVPSSKGGRVALREFLAFDEQTRTQLHRVPLEDLSVALKELVEIKGQTLLQAAEQRFNAAQISEETFEGLQQEFKAHV